MTDTYFENTPWPDAPDTDADVAERRPAPAPLRAEFTRFTEALVKHQLNEESSYADLDAFYAPSECYRDVARGLDRQLAALFDSYGYTAESYDAEARRRGVSYKWRYVNGVLT
jgi:SAM-dependent MidA family methyltransferase